MSEENLKRLKQVVYGLAVLYVMTFLSGFLQATPFNFVNYLLFSLLCLGGIVLIRMTVKSQAPAVLRGLLFLTGSASVLLLIFFLAYERSRLGGDMAREGVLESCLYGITLFFGIGVAGSLVGIRRRRRKRPDVVSA